MIPPVFCPGVRQALPKPVPRLRRASLLRAACYHMTSAGGRQRYARKGTSNSVTQRAETVLPLDRST